MRAYGTIADSLTYQRRAKQNLTRHKPIPKDPYTLAQFYQRCDYQHYADRWHTLSDATKQQYETDARPYHMTGFAYWMREQLTDLPYLAGRWHLDEVGGAVARDSSKQDSPFTFYGTTPIDAVISLGRYFDGVDDYGTAPSNAILDNITTEVTILAFFKYQGPFLNTYGIIFEKGWGNQYGLRVYSDRSIGGCLRKTGGPTLNWKSTAKVPDAVFASIGIRFKRPTLEALLNGVVVDSMVWDNDIELTTVGLRMGAFNASYVRSKGVIDEVEIHSEALSDIQIAHHAERRYP